MMKALAALLITASFLQQPTNAQTYSSFFEKDITSFRPLEDSFTPPASNMINESSMSPKTATDNYIDTVRGSNQLNSKSRAIGYKKATIGTNRFDPSSSRNTDPLNEFTRTTQMGCFVTQIGSTNCN